MSEAFAMEYKPTLAERFWRWCGYRTIVADTPPGADTMAGWMVTEVQVNISRGDRLRLLLSGRLRLRTTVYMDVQPSQTISTTDTSLPHPFGRGAR